MRFNRPAAALSVTVCLAALLLSCKSDPTTAPPKCRSTLSEFTSPAPGVVTLKGQFYADESILIYDLDANSLVAQGTPATDRTSFTFTGLASGRHYYLIKASGANGQENLDEGDFTVS